MNEKPLASKNALREGSRLEPEWTCFAGVRCLGAAAPGVELVQQLLLRGLELQVPARGRGVVRGSCLRPSDSAARPGMVGDSALDPWKVAVWTPPGGTGANPAGQTCPRQPGCAAAKIGTGRGGGLGALVALDRCPADLAVFGALDLRPAAPRTMQHGAGHAAATRTRRRSTRSAFCDSP